MNRQRLWLSCAAVFVFIFGFEWAFHGIVLKGLYAQTSNLWRSEVEMMDYFAWLVMGQLVVAVLFSYIFTKGYENQGMSEGVRYGLLVGLLMSAPCLVSYAVQPLPLYLVGAWVVGTLFEYVLAGIILVMVYRVPQSQ